jgi:hypothetical protein
VFMSSSFPLSSLSVSFLFERVSIVALSSCYCQLWQKLSMWINAVYWLLTSARCWELMTSVGYYHSGSLPCMFPMNLTKPAFDSHYCSNSSSVFAVFSGVGSPLFRVCVCLWIWNL